MSVADSSSPQPSPVQGGGITRVEVIGAGLAGCEAALQCARFGVPVRLQEMRPAVMTEAHETGDVAELVCSNSLKSDEPQNAHGLLKAELRAFGSVLLECAERARIPGGKALVVDRRRFSQEVQHALDMAGVEVTRQEVGSVPSLLGRRGFQTPTDRPGSSNAADNRDWEVDPTEAEGMGMGEPAITVIATGPLTSQPMVELLQGLLGTERLFFYDAIAPIVAAESLDRLRIFEGSRYGAGSDYLNCPMSEEEYGRFVDALLGAELHPLHDFEKAGRGLGHNPNSQSGIGLCPAPTEVAGTEPDGGAPGAGDCPRPATSARVPLFEGCLPVEEIARRGRLALAFGPMKPVGLTDPRTGRRPFAVVQLRRENEAGTMYNLVGFQTRLTHPEQERVFRLIPGLERAKFLRLGSIHRNTYLDAPKVLLPTLQTRVRADLLIAGQLAGVEGYVESIGAGLVAGINAARLAEGGLPLQFPAETMLGSLLVYITGSALGTVPVRGQPPCFQPMNANFGLLPALAERLRGRDKRRAMAERALDVARGFALTVAENRASLPVATERNNLMDNPRVLPEKATEMLAWSWSQFEPFYQELAGRKLSAANVEVFLADWTRLHDRLDEVATRLGIAKDANTADKEAEQRFNTFLEEIYPKSQEAEQKLKMLLLDSGLVPAGFELPLKKMQTDASLFREANLPLQVESAKLGTEYSKVIGGQTVQWDGKEVTVTQLRPVFQETNRARREQAWRLAAKRQLADRAALNELWQKLLALRLQMATNAGFADYRSLVWQEMLRFDYTPENCKQFHRAIEETVVPAAARSYQRKARQLGVDSLRPWDLDVDAQGRPALAPFKEVEQFKSGVHTILQRVDPQLGGYFQTMMAEQMLDLENRNNKAPGGYCATLEAAKRPFIFMNAVGMHGDVMTLIHESGHACHSFEAGRLPYFQQRNSGLEFAEVASMGMELLAAPYFARDAGGFYTREEAARAFAENLEKNIQFWPYMAVVDGFQHWVYENPAAATEPANCDRQWAQLWRRFMAGVDWTGLDDVLETGWQRKLHIFLAPFYYVEYGLAQLGAAQVWANALKDQAGAVAAYRRALALGGTKSLPELYATAGAKFAFDSATLGPIVGLMEEKLAAS